MSKEKKQINLFPIIFITSITILFSSSLIWSIQKEYQSVREFAKIEAEASYNKDLLYRRWATMHGGVYVPVTDVTPPNPYLKFIPERDITTESGRKLTLVNPAYMTRQVYDIAKEQYGVKGHITSLKPIRPENKADAWETEVLHKFETGVDEYNSIEKINDKNYIRFMHAMKVEKNCLKCHSSQGYKIGEIRGGISVSVPMERYTDVADSSVLTSTIIYILVYLSIIIIFIIGYQRYMRGLKSRIRMQEKILKDEETLILQNKEYAALNEKYKTQNEELYKAKEKAEENEQLNKMLFEILPIGLALTKMTGELVSVNKAYTEIIGYSEEETLLSSYWDITPQKYAEQEQEQLRSLNLTGFYGPYEKEYRHKSGELIPVRLIGRIVLINDEMFIWSSIENISEKKKSEQELIKAKEKAEESDRLKSAFLANMSHEIRTPMNGILGFAGLLKEPGLDGADQQDYIRIIEKSGERMLNIINDIIDVSKIESGLMHINIIESNIIEQIEQIYNFFKPEINAKGLQFVMKNSISFKEAVVKTDKEKVFAILTNLVKNAIKFTNNGSIEIGCDLINTANQIEVLKLYVKDSGIGVAKDRQRAIFDRFIQADIADKMAHQGAGLGLAISKSYVEMLGGYIGVDSEEGLGSTFYFTIPYNKLSQEEKTDESKIQNMPTGNPVNDLKIIIAEDDDASRMFLSIAVKDFCKVILKTKNGIEAVETYRENQDTDLIFMDIQMPGMNGYEAMRQIREIYKDAIIIAQTAYGLVGDREKALAMGCNDYISKPINKLELQSLILKYWIQIKTNRLLKFSN